MTSVPGERGSWCNCDVQPWSRLDAKVRDVDCYVYLAIN